MPKARAALPAALMDCVAKVIAAIRIACCALMLLFATATFADAAEQPRVLMLFANDRLLPANQRIDEGFRQTLDPRGNQSGVTIFTEFLDVPRLVGAEHEQMMEEYLRKRYRAAPPDALVVLGVEAVDFWFARRDRLFAGTPVVFGGVGVEEFRSLAGVSGVTGAPMDVTVAPVVEALLAMRPQTRRIVLVHGSSAFDRSWREIALRQCRPFADRVEITAFPELPLAELKERLAALPADTAVIYLSYFESPTGETYTPARVAREIAAASAGPVMGPYDTYLGTGVLGAACSPFEDEGAVVGRLTRRVLSGERPESIGILRPNPSRSIVDARQVKRWGIRSLPAGTEARFHTPTLWEEHRNLVMAVLAVVAVQSLLIALLARAWRREREKDASLAFTADLADVGLWQRDAATDEIQASLRWRTLFGLPATGRLRVDDVLARLHPDDRAIMRDAIDGALRAGSHYQIEYRVVLPDGGVRWISSAGRGDRRPDGKPLRSRGVSMDVTERKRIEAELAEQRRELAHLSRLTMLSTLSGSVAHELNQPLGIILSNAQAAEALLESDAPDLAEVRGILADIVKADRRAGEVIGRLRAFLKRGELDRRPHDVNEIVEDTVQLARGDLMARGVAVECDFAPGLPLVQCDRVQLQQVILNLVMNASDAMADNAPDARRITIASKGVDGRVRLSVRDTGCGLPPDVESIFQPLVTTKPQGLGLGLAISRSIAESHGGRLWAEARSKGAALHLELPIEEAAS